MIYSIVNLIVDTIATLMASLLLLRFWMQAVRVRPPIVLGQFMFRLTDWLVLPLRRLLPGIGGYDWASLIGALLVALVSVGIELSLRATLALEPLLLLSLLSMAHWIGYGLIALLIIEVIFSWVNPHAPLAPMVRALNEPLMRPIRRIVPPIGGLDLSPLLAFLILRIALFVADSILFGLP
ncbi:MAG: YggT family protein [Burkholderiaceae bacterium]